MNMVHFFRDVKKILIPQSQSSWTIWVIWLFLKFEPMHTFVHISITAVPSVPKIHYYYYYFFFFLPFLMVQSLIAFMDHMGGRDQGSVYIHYIIFSQYINVCMIDSSPYLSNSSIVIISFLVFNVCRSNLDFVTWCIAWDKYCHFPLRKSFSRVEKDKYCHFQLF